MDSVASDIAIYDDRAATEVAENLDGEVLTLLRQVSGLSLHQVP
jgi:acetylglutamate kinase